EAFLRAWRFRASMPAGESMKPWLYRVVVNTCCSKLRSEAPHRSHRADGAGLDDLISTVIEPSAAAEQASSNAALLAAIGELPEHLRIPVILRYWSGLSEKEIATAIGRRPGTVKSRLHEARQRLAAEPSVNALREVGS
ncbi:MAG: RNA polymerase sigma factor, partial [Acidimicrobiales bacterium]